MEFQMVPLFLVILSFASLGFSNLRAEQISPEDALRIVLDERRPLNTRKEVYLSAAYQGADGVRFNQEVARNADPSIASFAAASLIRKDIADVNELIIAQWKSWPTSEKIRVLTAGNSKFWRKSLPKSSVELARAALIQEKAVKDMNAESIELISLSALQLSRSDIRADRELIAEIFLIQHRAVGIWLALRGSEYISKEEARKVWNDEAVSMELRVASAIAISKLDSEAEKFAIGQIQGASRKNDAGSIRLFSMLVFLESDLVEGIVYDTLSHAPPMFELSGSSESVANALEAEGIYVCAAMIACDRWPEKTMKFKFKELRSTRLGEGLYYNVMLYLVLRHAELRDLAIKEIDSSRLDRDREIAERNGLPIVLKIGISYLFGFGTN